jgi:hypothetical protein
MKRCFVILGFLAIAGCSRPGQAPRATAEAFLDAHYVRIDLPAAQALASGLARDKIEKEIALTKDNRIDGETMQPRVNYTLQRADEAELAALYAYELTIRAPGVEPFYKVVTVTVRHADGAWSVTNYSEGDAREAHPATRPD